MSQSSSVATFQLRAYTPDPPLQIHAIRTSGTGFRPDVHTTVAGIDETSGVWTFSSGLKLRAVTTSGALKDSVVCVLTLDKKSGEKREMRLEGPVKEGVRSLVKCNDPTFVTGDPIVHAPKKVVVAMVTKEERREQRRERILAEVELGGGEQDFKMDSDKGSDGEGGQGDSDFRDGYVYKDEDEEDGPPQRAPGKTGKRGRE